MTYSTLEETAVRELIRRELLDLVREDRETYDLLVRLGRERFAARDPIEERIDRILDELRQDREENSRKWEENSRKWEEQRAEDKRKWEENSLKWKESSRKWEEQRAEDKRKREEDRQEFKLVHEEIMAVDRRIDRTIGALGARWGLDTERSLRDALAAILEKSFGVQVINVNEFDDEGTVFGRPEQVELDVVIHNGILILIEIKSSIDKAGMYSFERKARFYERRHGRKAQRLIVISPMIDPRAAEVGRQLGIELYTDSVAVPVDKAGAENGNHE